MKELKQRCSAAVHKQESLVRFTKTNDQKREENLNELKLRLNRQPKISDLFLTYENNESCETRRHESCYSAAAFMLAHSHINLQHQFAYKLIEDNGSNMAQKMIYIPACVSFCMPLINLSINSIFSSIQQIQQSVAANVASATKEDLLRS